MDEYLREVEMKINEYEIAVNQSLDAVEASYYASILRGYKHVYSYLKMKLN